MEKTKKQFRFANTSALLTYKTHLNKEKYIKWFEKKINQKCLFIRLAHETGAHEDGKDDYDHTHVVFKTTNKVTTSNQRFFDYKELHPHIKVLPSRKATNDAKVYISKEDPENSDLSEPEEINIVKGIWAKNNVQDALTKYVKKPNDAMGVITLFNMKAANLELYDEDIPKSQWQLDLIDETKEKPNANQRRKITWYCDVTGGCGKTMLARYLMIQEPNKWFMCKDMGTSKDAATVMKGAITGGWTGHGMIIDLPRQAANHKRMYSYIEEIKDGVVTTQKYAGGTCMFNKPHLIIFANWMPLFYMLSRDRWDVRILTKTKHGIEMTKYKPVEKDFVKEKKVDDVEYFSD